MNSVLPPLAERMRPTTLEGYYGQGDLVGPGAPIHDMLETGLLRSFILWGPPGVGKTTLARIIADHFDLPFFTLSAVSAGVKEVREVIRQAEEYRAGLFAQGAPILFIDEIHRFSKSQQDSLLHAVESGSVVLIGATTENPSFEVIRPLLSRCRVFVLEPLTKEDLDQLLKHTLETDVILKEYDVTIESTDALFAASGGDARKFLNILELIASTPAVLESKQLVISDGIVSEEIRQNPAVYDKGGEMHYDIISAFIKSIRGSDPDAAIYWLARMIDGGEDPKFIARRLVISASEDIGLANPNAMLIAEAAFTAVERIGWPEGRIPLAEATIYLAASPKSNSAYSAINDALRYVREQPPYPVPMHLRNAPTDLMEELGYGKEYIYPHSYPGHYVEQQYLPDEAVGQHFWTPADNPQEGRLADRLRSLHRGTEEENITSE